MRVLIISILVVGTAGCTSGQVKSYNQTLQNWKFSLNNPDDPELVKQVYFTLIPNPYDLGYPIETLGSWTFDTPHCSTGAESIKSSRTPAQDSKARNICSPTDKQEEQKSW